MNCSIKKCNNPAVEELELENGEINHFCGKNYYHSAKGWIASLTADKKYRKTEKGKKAVRKTLIKILKDSNKIKEKREQHKHYYEKNKDRLKDKSRKQYQKLSKESIKARNSKNWSNITHKALTKKKQKVREFRQAIYINNISEPQYYEFRRSIIKERGDKCEKCGINGKEKRLILHHKKYYIPDYKLLIKRSNILILCDRCHRINHTLNQHYTSVSQHQ